MNNIYIWILSFLFLFFSLLTGFNSIYRERTHCMCVLWDILWEKKKRKKKAASVFVVLAPLIHFFLQFNYRTPLNRLQKLCILDIVKMTWVSGTSVFICIVFFYFVYKLGRRNKEEKDRRNGIPRGSSGWPFLGETLDFISCGYSSTPVSFFQKRTAL